MKRRGKHWADKRIESVCHVEKINVCALLKFELMEAADLFQKLNGMGVATHKQVLSVINRIAGRRVCEGIRAPAQMIATFE